MESIQQGPSYLTLTLDKNNRIYLFINESPRLGDHVGLQFSNIKSHRVSYRLPFGVNVLSQQKMASIGELEEIYNIVGSGDSDRIEWDIEGNNRKGFFQLAISERSKHYLFFTKLATPGEFIEIDSKSWTKLRIDAPDGIEILRKSLVDRIGFDNCVTRARSGELKLPSVLS